ncbi:hypothetical protein H2199_008630 [Coniosporium tulheliwenetii]|uniref:Uncharacterized protein n=1 Tax=Coniosporium tulheliwenetii TaxID=3383036 RepID=A0ACC2YIX5_9PEZI|nr:hypothetical protein H2199_008630 [Cladosporium sp. JES 115]
MRSYFFHLAFELYPWSTPTDPPNYLRPIYLPPPDTDVFTSELPVHRTSSWNSPLVEKKTHKRTKTASSGAERSLPHRPSTARRLSHFASTSSGDHDNSLVGVHIGDGGRDRQELVLSRDWRFGSVTIQSIDMEEQTPDGAARPRGKSQVGTSPGRTGARGRYVPSTPKDTDVGWGVVHLYRDAQETPGLYDDTRPSTGSDSGKADTDAQPFNEEDCTTLCILAVPSYMTPSDLLGFCGEQTREDVSHFRLIRTAISNRYMVLMKFREAKAARAWQKAYNGKLFNSMESENCHVVFVKSISFHPDDSASRSPPRILPIHQAPPPPSSAVELPSCPVCLEHMDETSGLLTILCQHVFHCGCLSKWRGSGCPVCRYTQSDLFLNLRGGVLANGEMPENECSVCSATSNLWICLICGNTGCGRYDEAHAYRHYEETSHSYAMDVATQHVWDYAGDGYVHRLIQNKSDKKLIDLPGAFGSADTSMTGLADEMVPREKMENMGVEYTYLLTSQLDSQRLYFEEQLERAVDKASKASSVAEEASAQMKAMMVEFRGMQVRHEEARGMIAGLEKEVARLTSKSAKSEELARKVMKD